ncbi:MAG: hypothetical protein J7M08_04720 [Planctomycetes bacterium]|nr:hypothetical protein [Planctomycetota bacterium]
MNDLERFKAVCAGEQPDYVPIFGFPGAPGMSRGAMKKTHDRLVATGMPPHVGGSYDLGSMHLRVDSWKRYWGTTDPLICEVGRVLSVPGLKTTRRIEGEYEIIESEAGDVTRQLIDNDITYIMPEFVEYPVRDRESWEFWKKRMTPTALMPLDEVREQVKQYENRERPLVVHVPGSYGYLRGLLGPQRLSTMFFDDPELIHDMMRWILERTREEVFPVVEAVRPEIMQMGEDLCYNHGMLLSPAMFDEFCGQHYQEVCDFARACDVTMVAVDTDGNVMEFAGLAASYGVNGLFPCEVKAGNDLFRLREQGLETTLFGWLEKETVNEGNEADIEPEIRSKVPPLLEQGRYFPNGDHGIQPMVTFPSLCKFMTILHEVCGNPEGEFPRV